MDDQSNFHDRDKIAILLPSLLGGGTERVILLLAHEFKKYIKEIHLLTLEKGSDYEVSNDIFYNFLSPFERNKKKEQYIIKNLYHHKQIYNLQRYLKKHNIKTVLSFLERANALNIFSNLFYRHRTIANTRVTLSKNYGKYQSLIKRIISHAIFKYFLPKADLIICNSKGVEYDLVKNFDIQSDKIKVIYNPFDIDKIKLLSEESLEPQYKEIFDSPVIINVGRLSTQKAQWHIIKAFKKVKEKINNAKLVILGDGGYGNRLQQLAWATGFANEIHFLGFQRNPYKFVAKAKVSVLSSMWEGFPNVIVESMICKTPVISTDCRSGPREILAPDSPLVEETKTIEFAPYGILVPVMDGIIYSVDAPLTREESLFADAITAMLKNENLRNTYSAKALNRAEDFRKDKIIKEYLDTILL